MTRDEGCHLIQQSLVFLDEGSDGIRVDIELADYPACVPDQDDQLGARVDRAGEV